VCVKQIGRPRSVWLFECKEEVARDRFVCRNREDGDNEAMFERWYAEYVRNLLLIRARYEDLLKVVSWFVTLECRASWPS